jgi:hypothetical protein
MELDVNRTFGNVLLSFKLNIISKPVYFARDARFGEGSPLLLDSSPSGQPPLAVSPCPFISAVLIFMPLSCPWIHLNVKKLYYCVANVLTDCCHFFPSFELPCFCLPYRLRTEMILHHKSTLMAALTKVMHGFSSTWFLLLV